MVVGALWLVGRVWRWVSVAALVWGSCGVMGVEDLFEVFWVIGFFHGAIGLVVPELLVLLWGFWWVR